MEWIISRKKEERKRHYWRATLLSHSKTEDRFARWVTISEDEYFPAYKVEHEYMDKYGLRPVILFWGEISEQDYIKLSKALKITSDDKD